MPPSSPQATSATESDPSPSIGAGNSRFRLKLLGPWDLTAQDGHRVQSVLSQPKRLCLLAYLALSAEPVSRSKVVALFWPETDEEHARNALSQSLHYLRRSMGKNVVENVEGDRIIVRADFVDFDARTLLSSGAPSGDNGTAFDPQLLRGEFFEGWNADGSLPLQDWLDATRLQVRTTQSRIAAAYPAAALEDDPALRVTGDEEVKEGVAADPALGENANESASEERPPIRRLLPLGGGLAFLAAALVLVILTLRANTPAPAADSTPVAVIMPRLAGSGVVNEESLGAIHMEIVNRLSPVVEPGLQLLSVPFANSPAELERILEAQSEVPIPHQIIDVLIRVNGAQTVMNASLLAGGGYVLVLATAGETYYLESEAEALLRLPGEIADLLASEFGPELGGR